MEKNRLIRRDERSKAEVHCQPLACQLQACASQHIYKPKRCDALKATYNACLKDFWEAAEKAK